MRKTQPALKAGNQIANQPITLTHWGLRLERFTRAFWPVWTLVLAGLAAVFLGAHEFLTPFQFWVIVGGIGIAIVVLLVHGWLKYRDPDRDEALTKVDATLEGRPLAALADQQAIGATDQASRDVWVAHQQRMETQASSARAVAPDLKISHIDRWGLRLMAATAFVMALGFGSIWKVESLGQLAPASASATSVGPSWEGWLEPPAYTGKPSLYLNELKDNKVAVPVNSRLILRLYGQIDKLAVYETVSGIPPQDAGLEIPETGSIEFLVKQSGQLNIAGGPEDISFNFTSLVDLAPSIQIVEAMEFKAGGEMRQEFAAQDDYGIQNGAVLITLNETAIERRFGLAAIPEEREAIELDLPMPIRGDKADFKETLVERFENHAWSGLPVTMTLSVIDALGQVGQSEPLEFTLPGRRFFDPLAAAIVENRRDILWALSNGPRASQIIRAVSHLPEGFIKNDKAYLLLRVALRRLEAENKEGLGEVPRDEVAELLWNAALSFEDGDLASALEKLRRAQDRLSEAMRNGANKDEIDQLMQEMREAMNEYIQELAEQTQRDEADEPNQEQSQNSQSLSSDQLEQMLQELQEMMEQGQMAEAERLMDAIRELLENMQVTQNGEQGQSEGQQAMEGLADSLREQQGLSDDAFRDLQEQQNPNAQAGNNSQNRGRNGDQGQGQSHEPGQGDGSEGGENGESGQPSADSLAERQQDLQDRLNQQRGNLPNAGSEAGQAAREALDRAGEAMGRASENLENNELAEALDNQSDALEAMREGMRNLGEAMAQEQSQGQQQGTAQQNPNEGNPQDPLGREAGNQGRVGSDENLLQGEDVYRRARELLDEIRRRSGEQNRPEVELDYLKRLLDRFQ